MASGGAKVAPPPKMDAGSGLSFLKDAVPPPPPAVKPWYQVW